MATFLFALVATAQVGRGDADFVPTRTLLAALALTLLSTAMFLLLIDRTVNGLRVANVVQRLDAAARAVFDTVYAADTAEVADADQVTGDFIPFGRRRFRASPLASPGARQQKGD